MKGNLKRSSSDSLSPVRTHNKDIGTAIQMLLIEVKLCLQGRLVKLLIVNVKCVIAIITVKVNYLYMTGLLIFHVVAEPRNSGKSAKSCEIHKNMQNTAKFGRNLIKYMSVQHF